MLSTESDATLDAIVKKSQEKSPLHLLPEEVKILTTAFLPSHPFAHRSKAFLTLSALCEHFRGLSSSKPDGTHADTSTVLIDKTFSSTVVANIGDTAEQEVLAGLTFLTSLFQVDSPSGSAILQRDGVVESIVDAIELFPQSTPISLAIAQLLSQAAGHKSSRALIPTQSVQWLESKTRPKEDSALRAPQPEGDEQLVSMMKGLVLSGASDLGHHQGTTSLGDAVEGLAYMSVDPAVKELLASDPAFLKGLFATVPRRKGNWAQATEEEIGMTPLYGTALIIANICAYKPRLTEEEAQIAKLRNLAKASGAAGGESATNKENPLEDNAHVLARCRRLITAGGLDALTAIVRATDSRAVRLVVGKALLYLVEEKENRGKVLQAGGAKALITIIQGILPSPTRGGNVLDLDASCMDSIQALAKLTITSAPVQVFGPNVGALLDSIRPLSIMLVHSSSNLLQRFEAMMALTNLSSQSEEAAGKIATADGLVNRVELFMLEDHTMIRRAATELICNLVAGSEDVFNRFGGSKDAGSKSKLQVLAAMCDVDDLPTRLAASGALATLTSSPVACDFLVELQRERSRILPIFGSLIDPSIVPPSDVSTVEEAGERDQSDPGLIHRGAVCLRNFFAGIQDVEARQEMSKDAQRIGIVRALAKVFKDNSADRSSPVLRPIAEALKILMESGATIVV
ncbi:hypothetical protein NLI96_g2031 [Meripilus lineatus]|uniref:UNC-45/Cro1/She4 central domain-containing protein n=1 Tax=Meripilus lineatus TaxID=2056292 RepID=A0AAD5VDT8_9APHY|nr:hypothetical protein NLI96_g2031 [Physisporinus lineatus]